MEKLNEEKNVFFNEVVVKGIKEGFQGSLAFIKIMLPISLVITILKYLGFISVLSKSVSPLFKFIGLRGEAIIALISGYLVNCYSAIAVMSTLHLSIKEITIISAMLVLCHTLPIELSIQKKAGGSFFLIMLIRIFSSLIIGVVLNWIIKGDISIANPNVIIDTTNNYVSFSDIIISWVLENAVIINIIIINITLTIFYNILKRYRLIEKIGGLFRPVMIIFGLPKETAFLWIVTNVIGLIYGATMLVDAKNSSNIDNISLKKLNVSIATCHSIIQETANFMAIGASIIYLILPRVIISIISVWIYSIVLVCGNSKASLKDNFI